ncbi:ACT domain-containing protein [Leifsonia virtsii]|uniref:ACT domain-containing protein n=1 Tax=Leifsonia virtsii TaxID=3035915 RepID=A0ABT8IXQ1_9MICO|nr:ACT domain-containing protein [Leifsonia virtsii]MDN4597597.1 ACT domain-containing protein [Leifsonia virtsii]
MSAADLQTLRILDGRYVLERLTTDAPQTEVLATVHGPDGGARMRRDDSAAADTWVALWNGDAAHSPEATGMLAVIVTPLAAGGVPVWTAASYDGDIVLVPQDRFADVQQLLRDAGHAVH